MAGPVTVGARPFSLLLRRCPPSSPSAPSGFFVRHHSLSSLRRLPQSSSAPHRSFPRQRRLNSTTAAAPDATTPSPINTSTTNLPPPPKKPLPRRILTFLLIATVSTTVGFAMTAAPVTSAARELLSPPTDAETLSLFTPSTPSQQEIEDRLFKLPLVQSLLDQPDQWTPSRPHMRIPEAMRPQNLTGGTLLGDEKIVVPPLVFSSVAPSTSTAGEAAPSDRAASTPAASPATEEPTAQTPAAHLPELVSVQYLGASLCGHPQIIHGGLLATLLDEGLARCCFSALPHRVGVTASLNLTYKAPTLAGQFVVLRAQTTKVDGRKAWVRGWIETLPDPETGAVTRLVEADALFVEPRQAAKMAKIYSGA